MLSVEQVRTLSPGDQVRMRLTDQDRKGYYKFPVATVVGHHGGFVLVRLFDGHRVVGAFGELWPTKDHPQDQQIKGDT